jgi:hypothetical protein
MRLAPLVLVLATLLPGCAMGLTNSMWNAQRCEPVELKQAVLARNGTVVVDVETTIGPLRLSKAPDASTDMMNVGEADGPLPEGRAIVLLAGEPGAASEVSSPSGVWIALGPSGHHDGQLLLTARSSAGYRRSSLWYLRPVDFGRWQSWAAAVATPVTVALDVLVIAPLEYVWMGVTGGEHGPLFDFDGT